MAYFNMKETKLKFKFPQPGPIEGVKSRSKALMKMSHCDFTYPGNTVPTLFDITIQVSMASRVGCVGENGAGKSTMIKVPHLFIYFYVDREVERERAKRDCV